MAAILSLVILPAIYIGVMFTSIGARIAYALAKHGGIRGSPLFTTPIASVAGKQYKQHPAFRNINERVKESIRLHESAHLKGHGEILAYLRQAVGLLIPLRSKRTKNQYELETFIEGLKEGIKKEVESQGVYWDEENGKIREKRFWSFIMLS